VVRLPRIVRERIVERGNTVGQRLAEAEHEAHRELVRGGCAKPLGVALAREIRHADQRLRSDRRAGHADLMVAPQHRQHRDGKPRAPGGETVVTAKLGSCTAIVSPGISPSSVKNAARASAAMSASR
jgi:hypothetical protein